MQPETLDATSIAGSPTRRAVLRAGAAAGGGLLLGILGSSPAPARADNRPGASLNAFIRVARDGRVTMIAPAIEMGQGTRTSIAAMLAEELDVELEQVTVKDAPADQTHYGSPLFVIQMTGGSTTTMAWFMPLRKTGASARAMLVAAAAHRWRVEPASCRTSAGVVHHDPSGRLATYGSLSDLAAGFPAPKEPALKDAKDFKLIGRSLHRLDSPDKVVGKTVFGIDVMRPGMKFATLAASPTFGGKVGHVDESAARRVPGVRQIVVLDDLVAVVADHYWAAKKGLDALVVEWSPGQNASVEQSDIWTDLENASKSAATLVKQTGDIQGLQQDKAFSATYELPFLAHAAMEPMNCTVEVTPGHCEIWVGTQVPGKAQFGAATVLGLKPEQVFINNHLIGGGFGRRLEPDGIVKAVRIAQHVVGPVKVVWSREEDIRQALYRPIYRDRLDASVIDGRLLAWRHRATGAAIMARFLPPAFQNGIDPDATDSIETPYTIPNSLAEYVRFEAPAVPTTFWRGVGPNSTVFSRECFIDLIATGIGADPVAFRRSMLTGNLRALGVLELAVEQARWGTPAPPPVEGRTGRGFALLTAFGSFLAAVADVVVADDGDVRVTRVVVAVDVGTVVNPDTVTAQVQGGVIFGISAILHGQVTVAKGSIVQSNFHDYRVLRIDETPLIETHIVGSHEPPGGIGEPGTVVVQPAIANAIFAATGVQLTRMPVDRFLLAKRGS